MYEDITVEDYKARFKDGGEAHILLDVRTPPEFEMARIAGALNIPLQEVPNRTDEIEDAADDLPVVIVCQTGVRSMQAAQFLKQVVGFEMPIYNLDTGVVGWAKQKWPLERGPE